MSEINDDIARMIRNAIVKLNTNAEKREERRERDHAEMRQLLGGLKESITIFSVKLDEARHDIEDLTPPLGHKFPESVPQQVDREQSWKVQLGGAVSLGKKIWPYAKWAIHIASATGGGVLVARLFAAAFGRR